MSSLIKNNTFVGKIKRDVSAKEYIRMLKQGSGHRKIESVKFVRPKLGRDGDLGKFRVTFK